jgi:putative sterol carrier protein
MPESEPTMSVEAQLFHSGVRQYLQLLISNIESHPNFKKEAEGLGLSLSMAIRTPESFRQFNIADTYINLNIFDQHVEFTVDIKPFKADVVIEAEWITWKNIIVGQEDLVDSLTTEKIRILEGSDKLNFGMINILAESMKNSQLHPELVRLIEPGKTT